MTSPAALPKAVANARKFKAANRLPQKHACKCMADDRRKRIAAKRGRDERARIQAQLREPNDGPKRPLVRRLLGLLRRR